MTPRTTQTPAGASTCPGGAAAPDGQLAAAQATIAQLRQALHTNRRIAMAVGILMAQRKTSEQDAFAALRNASQATHRRISDLAEDVIYLGDLVIGEVAGATPQSQRRELAVDENKRCARPRDGVQGNAVNDARLKDEAVG